MPNAQPSTIGVLLLNTGTPDAPEEKSIAAYLREFLMDPILIGAPWPIRRLIVGRIAATRPQQTVERYKSFWTKNGSPFLLTCMKQREMLQEALSSRGAQVALAMRYGNPSIQRALSELRSAGCTRLVVVPSYPQFTFVCAGTCLKAVRRALGQMRWAPELIEIEQFYDQPAYRAALADSVRRAWEPDPVCQARETDSITKVLVSCHSTLMKHIEAGDPYRDQVEATAAHLADDLGLDCSRVLVSYQSRFDSRKWLQPSTETAIQRLAEDGISVVVLCPIFVADNLETLWDVDQRLRQTYEQNSPEGCTFTYVPCLNDDPGLIRALAAAIESRLG